MKSLKEFSDLYPSDEKILWEENQVLMKDLKANLSSLASNKYEKELVEVLNPDGFYPYYTHQKVKNTIHCKRISWLVRKRLYSGYPSGNQVK